MKVTLFPQQARGSILSALILTVVSLSLIGLLGGMGLSFMTGAAKHHKAEAEAAEIAAAAASNAPAPVAAPAPAPADAPVAAAEPAPAAADAKPTGAPAAADGAVTEIVIETHPMQFLYTVTEFTVKSGDKVKINFKNTSTQVPQPHNLVICKPGKKGAIEALAMQLMTDPNAMQKGYIPESEDIFAHSKLIQPGQAEFVEFVAPAPGAYDYLCTFPGHWILMKGVMTVN